MSIVREALDAYATTPRTRFHRGRDKSVGASEIGQCTRKVWWLKHPGDTRNDGHKDSWGASRRGSVFESRFFVPAMRKHYGDKLKYAGGEQRRLSKGYLSATPDGLLIKQPRNALAGLMVPDIGPSGEIVIECKSIDPRIKLSEAKPEHVFQAQVQLGLFRELTKHKPDYAVIVYTNASFFDDNIEFVTKFDPAVFEHAKQRAAKVMTATSPSELRPEGWISGGSECDYCPFSTACRRLRGGVPDTDKVTNDPQFIAEITDLAREEREWSKRVQAAATGQRELQEKIKVRLREKGLRKISGDGLNVVWSNVVGRPAFDIPALKAAAQTAGFDLQRFERVGEPSDRLTIQVSDVRTRRS